MDYIVIMIKKTVVLNSKLKKKGEILWYVAIFCPFNLVSGIIPTLTTNLSSVFLFPFHMCQS